MSLYQPLNPQKESISCDLPIVRLSAQKRPCPTPRHGFTREEIEEAMSWPRVDVEKMPTSEV